MGRFCHPVCLLIIISILIHILKPLKRLRIQGFLYLRIRKKGKNSYSSFIYHFKISLNTVIDLYPSDFSTLQALLREFLRVRATFQWPNTLDLCAFSNRPASGVHDQAEPVCIFLDAPLPLLIL